jgi:hypothetical protein
MIVDFSGRVKMYRDISFQPTMPFAQTGRDMFANVLQKMQAASVRDAVFSSPRTWDKHTQNGLETFATMAAEKEVDLHLRLIHASEKPGKLEAVLKKVNQPNLHIACNPLVESLESLESPVGIMLLATVGEPITKVLPLHKGNATRPKIDSGKIVVFDAEYLNWNEIERDAEWWE